MDTSHFKHFSFSYKVYDQEHVAYFIITSGMCYCKKTITYVIATITQYSHHTTWEVAIRPPNAQTTKHVTMKRKTKQGTTSEMGIRPPYKGENHHPVLEIINITNYRAFCMFVFMSVLDEQSWIL